MRLELCLVLLEHTAVVLLACEQLRREDLYLAVEIDLHKLALEAREVLLLHGLPLTLALAFAPRLGISRRFGGGLLRVGFGGGGGGLFRGVLAGARVLLGGLEHLVADNRHPPLALRVVEEVHHVLLGLEHAVELHGKYAQL